MSNQNTQVSKTVTWQFLLQIFLTILTLIVTPLLTLVVVKHQIKTEFSTWRNQQNIVYAQKLHEARISAHKELINLISEYQLAYGELLTSHYLVSPHAQFHEDMLKIGKDYETDYSGFLDNYQKAFYTYLRKKNALDIHLQYCAYIFSPNTCQAINNFALFISTRRSLSEIKSVNIDELRSLVESGIHPTLALAQLMQKDLNSSIKDDDYAKFKTDLFRQMAIDIFKYTQEGLLNSDQSQISDSLETLEAKDH